ncbi:PIKK family atypical protein kinase [Tritrichomonas foetus]|uniref:Serine/threonine-protein kinase TOR n=1 Tax=Tritrichomonas foetus TaxID=1144522 RepID=A0A1J4KU01_9EUKA|nr:PIKK family atypical protein kinase [Tritrichomonas foetus]|eukprot:OHT14761.1 PIKK family atypical protein kinase [Tritrichomonas foetus]
MEFVLASLPLPPTFKDLLDVSDAIWSTIVDGLRNLKTDELNEYAEKSLLYLKALAKSKEPSKFQRLTLGLRCIFHIFNETSKYEDLISLLYICTDSTSMQFAAHTIAEIAAALPPNDDNFSRRHLEYALSLIKTANTNNQIVLMGLFLLRELAVFIPLQFLLHSADLLDQIWTWLISSSPEIREASAQVLERYLNVLVKYQGYRLKDIFETILHRALSQLLNTPTNCPQGVLVVILLLLKAKGHFFQNSTQEIYLAVKPFLTSKKLEARAASITVIAQLSEIDPELFTSELYETSFKAIIDSGEVLFSTSLDALSTIIKNVPSKVTEADALQIHRICTYSVRKNFDIYVPNMFNVLSSLTEYVPKTINLLGSKLWDLFHPFLFSDSFVGFFPTLNRVVPTFWANYSVNIGEKIIETLEMKPEHSGLPLKTNALKLIPLLPPLPRSHSSSILTILKRYVFHKSESPRSLTSRALLHLMQGSSPSEIHQTLHQLLEIASSDDSIEVRVEYLNAFSSQHYPDLAHSIFLHFFQKLSHDISPHVRSASFLLMKHLQPFSPLGVNIILRHSLIGTFYSLQCSNSLMLQVRNAQVLPTLVSASPKLFNVYATSFIPIVLSMLTQRFAPGTTVSMNPLDPELRSQLALSLILTLHELVLNDFKILSKFLESFIKICSTILGEWGDKPLKHAVLITIFDYVSRAGTPAEVLNTAPELLPTLFSLIENCNSRSLRVRALKFIGLCGAVSPKRLRSEMMIHNNVGDSLPDLFLVGNSISYNDFFLEVVFVQLKQMLHDKSLRSMKVKTLSAAIEALDIRSNAPGQYFPDLVPIILNEVEGDNAADGLALLDKFIYVARQRIVKFVSPIMKTLHQVWSTVLFPGILSVVAALVGQVGPDFLPYAAQLITNLLDVLSSSIISRPSDAMRCIPLLASICPSFPHLSQLMVPHICTISTADSASKEIKLCAMNSLRFLVQTTKNEGNAASILRVSLIHCVSNDKELSNLAFQVLYSLMVRLGRSFNLYTHRVVEKLAQHKIMPTNFLQLNAAMMTANELKLTDFPFIDTSPLMEDTFQYERRKMFNPRPLIEQFNSTYNMTTPKHWQSWFSSFVLSFIKESPNVSIRSCSEIAVIHRPLATSLFFPAFLSCWIYMGDESRIQISQRIGLILERPGLPPDVLQCFARLCEYMNRAEKPLLISSTALTPVFISAQCLALALHNEEERLQESSTSLNSPDIMKSVIQLYASLGKSGAAKALLQANGAPETWLLKLGQWDEAFDFFQKKIIDFPNDDDGFVGYISSCGKLRKFDLIRKSAINFSQHDKKSQIESSIDFANAFFFGGDYEEMLKYAELSPGDSVDGHISRAQAHLMLGERKEALHVVESAFALVAAQSSALFCRRYETIYPTLLRCQILYELQEIAEKSKDVPRVQWSNRIRSVEYTSEVWWPLIMTRMAFQPRDETTFILFLELILHERRFEVFESTFKLFYPNFTPQNSDEFVILQYLKYVWATGDRPKALNNLRVLLKRTQPVSRAYPQIFKFYVDWALTLSGRNTKSLKDVIKTLRPILCLPKQNYIVWQRWATVNYHMFSLTPTKMKYAVEAIKGYIYCISQVGNGNFSEIVQLLSLFFATSTDKSVLQATKVSMSHLSSKIFVETIPQLIAQLAHKSQDTVEIVKKILSEIAVSDYQLLLFPLLVAKMSPDSKKSDVAMHLLNEINVQHATVVQQAMKMQNSLLLAAATVFERVSKMILQYFELVTHKKFDESFQLLLKIQQTIVNPSSSFDRLLHQVTFVSLQSLMDAVKDVLTFTIEQDTIIDTVGRHLRQILSDIDKFMDKLTILTVNDVCPELSKLKDTEILVPGGPKDISIKSFSKSFDVLGSKKRPRKAAFEGSDGNTYKYLLKGNEDLRLDQRVMQFFRLINTQIRHDYSLSIDNVMIRCYTIVSLSPDVGLIQWVEGGDTFHSHITEYRVAHNIDMLAEHNIEVKNTIKNTDKLRPIQRYESFMKADEKTDSSDLRCIFWLKSLSSDAWLEKTTKFARSTALMSIVGYVLGLGDRHPSNFMIDRNTGDVVHIDFGDCFEVAKNRVYFPEEIPFRLTRMILSAFGVCGIEGDFRPVSERVMMLVRDNSNSLVSVLEIFVQEPIQDGETVLPTLEIMPRIWQKILGTDFGNDQPMPVSEQVTKLIDSAINKYNLSMLYSGWCPLW